MSCACLIFPPLVNTGFGQVYPSTAVLAGYLEHHGFRTLQLDLNEELAVEALIPENLRSMGEGYMFPGERALPKDHPASVAARLLLKNRGLLFDPCGRHNFADESGPGYLLKALTSPFLIDTTVNELIDLEQTAPSLCRWYDDFFGRCNLDGRLEIVEKVVGITVPMGPQIAPTIRLARFIKRIRPDLRIILGGPTLSLMDISDLTTLLSGVPEIDAAVRFDGEEPLRLICQNLTSATWNPNSIAGLTWYDGDGLRTNPAMPGPSIGTLPPPLYCQSLVSRIAQPELGVVVTRGCYWGRCVYCDFVELYGNSRPFRTRRVGEVISEITHLSKIHDCTRFSLITEALAPAFARKFSDAIIEDGIEIEWNTFAMVDDRFDEKMFGLMAVAGCSHLVVGVECMNDRVLALVEKAGTREGNLRYLRNAAGAGLNLYVNIIPDLPTTTYDEAMDDLVVFQSIEDILEFVAIYPFEATRSSEIGRNPLRYGLTLNTQVNHVGQAEYAGNHLLASDQAMTDAQRSTVHSAYFDFAERINARRVEMPKEWRELGCDQSTHPSVPSEERLFRLVPDDFDIVESNGVARVYNWRRRTAWEVPLSFISLFEVIGTGPFPISNIGDIANNRSAGSKLVMDLLKLGFAAEI